MCFNSVLIICDCAFVALLHIAATMTEVCANKFEPLDISCGGAEVIVTTSAWFGRMRFNKCFDSEPGDMGCKTDVLHLVDKWCSGRRECHQQVPNREIMTENQCSTDYGLYLEVDYTCVSGILYYISW